MALTMHTLTHIKSSTFLMIKYLQRILMTLTLALFASHLMDAAVAGRAGGSMRMVAGNKVRKNAI